MTLLQAKDLTVRYGGVTALECVSLGVGEGEIVALVGPNGAGKTTLLECVAGSTTPNAGTVEFAGADVSALGPAARARRGLIRSFADAALFPALTVEQVLLLAHERTAPTGLVASILRLPSWRSAEAARLRAAGQLIAAFGLEPHADKLVAELSAGLRRALDLACSVALQPRLLLLDEPSAGLAHAEVEQLARTLLRVRSLTGASMVVIEHDLPLAFALADRVMVMDAGRVVAEGSPAEVRRHPLLGHRTRRRRRPLQALPR
jgi:ABC-type branched-subunit amino acid transport system ATPase component